LLDREIGRLRALEDLVYERRRPLKHLHAVGGVRHEATALGERSIRIDRRHSVLRGELENLRLPRQHDGARQHDEAGRAGFREGGERALDIVGPSYFQPKHGGAASLCRRLDLSQERGVRGLVCEHQDAHPFHAGHGLREELQPLGAQPLRKTREPRHVAARASQAPHQSHPDRIARADHDDGNRLRRPRQRRDRRIAEGRNDVQLEADELGRQRRKPFEARVRQARLDDEVLALDVPEVAEALPKRFQVPGFGGVCVSEIPEAPDLRRLLRLAGERCGEDADHKGDCECSAEDRQAAPAVCWLSTVVIFRPALILRKLIPEA
jgi:hypothetical protein